MSELYMANLNNLNGKILFMTSSVSFIEFDTNDHDGIVKCLEDHDIETTQNWDKECTTYHLSCGGCLVNVNSSWDYVEPHRYPTYEELEQYGEVLDSREEGTVYLYELGHKEWVVLCDNTVIPKEEDTDSDWD